MGATQASNRNGRDMIILHWLTGIALAGAQAAASSASPQAPAPESTPSSATVVAPMDGFSLGKKSETQVTRTEAATTLSRCSDRQFEASAEGMIGGEFKRRRITLCAAPGESDAQWTVRLENAVIWVRAQKDLSDPVKDQLIAELRDEIARGKTRGFSAARPSAALPSSSLSSSPLSAADRLVATVPPMPPPLPYPSLSASSLLTPPKLARLPLTVRCLGAGEQGAGTRCENLDPDTVFAVHADANLASPATLRFLRRGETRAEIPVAALRQGQITRFKLPPPVCSRVTGSIVTIQILAGDPTTVLGNRVAEELGPFRLRC
jgi:hypothetical protein